MINIFLLNWNSTELVLKSLSQLTKSTYSKFRVILINNFYSETDLQRIREIHYQFVASFEIFLVENESNLGYAGGNNKGLKFLEENNLSGDILILNPDILISENTIFEMERRLVDGVGIVTVRMVNQQNKVILDAIKLNGFIQHYVITQRDQIETEYAQGACLLIKRRTIENLGFFDERFFLYWEEVDFSLRVRKYGEQLISITTTQVVRLKNDLIRQPPAFYYSVRNALLIKSKHPDHFNRLDYLIYINYMLILSLKFITNFKILTLTLRNIYFAIKDSRNEIYYGRVESK
ncbi:MAG: glycosyltransferase family 2 protein [Mariniphaga sp.]